jgi:hypothetical protein
MAYISYAKKDYHKVGDRVVTTRVHESMAGYFESGTAVTVVAIDPVRGYEIRDEHGNRMCEIGWII